jgi:hypothetical protein
LICLIQKSINTKRIKYSLTDFLSQTYKKTVKIYYHIGIV